MLMATLKPELRTLLDRYGIDPRDKSQIWDCHGTLVLYHKAYEVIAAKEKITFDPPTVIEGSSADKTAVILVVGRMGDRQEWSIGEAAPGNCKNAYPYAMAEKRAKDRVVAKLAGLAQYVYSEDEADEFKEGERKPAENGHAAQKPPAKAAPVLTRDEEFFKRPSYDIDPAAVGGTTSRWESFLRDRAAECRSLDEFVKLEEDNLPRRQRFEKLSRPDVVENLRAYLNEIHTALQQKLPGLAA
jgi:hypothetical protein